MKTDNLKEAAIWFETLRASSPKYAKGLQLLSRLYPLHSEAL